MTEMINVSAELMRELMQEVHLSLEAQKHNGETMDRIWALVRLLPPHGLERLAQIDMRLEQLEARVERLEKIFESRQ